MKKIFLPLLLTLLLAQNAFAGSFFSKREVPQGTILMWSGTVASIPAGYELSDGTCNISCPDLRNKMIVGANTDTTGVATSTISGSASSSGGTATIDISHNHTFSATTGLPSAVAGANGGADQFAINNHTHDVSGTTSTSGSATQSILNPYYVLCFIIRD